MRTINELAELQKKGARKWLSDLVYYILPKANQGWTYALISQWLEKECDISLNEQGIYRALKKYRGRYENIEPQIKVDRPQTQRKPIQKKVSEPKPKNSEIVQYEEQADKSKLIKAVISELLDESPNSIIERQEQKKKSRFKGKKW